MNNTDKEKIGMLFLGPFPEGNVSTLRIYSYCKALANRGHFVKVYIIAPTNEAKINKLKQGIIDNIHFQYATDITWDNKNRNILYKICKYIVGIFKTLKLLQNDKISILLTYHNELISNIIFRLFCQINRIPFVLDKTEYPIGKLKPLILIKTLDKFKLSLFDGIITITNELKIFYQKYLNLTKNKVFLLPMTIDSERFKNVNSALHEDYIAVLFGTHNRDGLYESVYSYFLYTKLMTDIKPYKLLLIGDFDTLCKKFPETKKIVALISDNQLEKYIQFEGIIPSRSVPNYLASAKILMTTPTKFVSGGFPTKLGEYLLSGTPVLTTPAGEIPLYLTNNEDVFMSSKVDNFKELAYYLFHIHMNPEEGNRVANNGKIKAETHFNAETYVNELICFLKKLI